MATTIEWAQGSITVDAMVNAGHARSAVVTQHPIESGASVTDHIRPVPRVLSMSGWLATAPISEDAAAEVVDAQTRWNELQKLLGDGELLTIRTRLQTYENVVLSSISAPQNASSGASLQFSATFTEVRFVETAEVQVNLPTKKSRGKNKRDDGARPAEEVPDPADNKTAFARVVSGAASLVVN